MLKYLIKKLFWGFLQHVVTDKLYAQIRYWLKFDRLPNLQNPQTFTEKIQHIKLYERTEIRKAFADRTRVRDYVADKIGEQHLIPLHGIYEELDTGVWDSLPSQFVLKANHGCGMLEIVRDKRQADYDSIHRQTENWKHTDYYKVGREWAYKDLPRTILAEQLLLDSEGSIPNDYKFFCFHGRVKIIQIDIDRFGDQRRNLYDRNFNPLDATLLYPNYKGTILKPDRLEEALEIAEVLSSEINFMRVDLYLMANDIYFGELTNYPGNGFVEFEPQHMAHKMGTALKL